MTSGPTGLILILCVVVLALLVLARKSPFQLIGRILGFVFRPLYRFLVKPFLSLLRAMGVLKPSAKAGQAAAAFGPTSWSALSRAFRMETDVEHALSDDGDRDVVRALIRVELQEIQGETEDGDITDVDFAALEADLLREIEAYLSADQVSAQLAESIATSLETGNEAELAQLTQDMGDGAGDGEPGAASDAETPVKDPNADNQQYQALKVRVMAMILEELADRKLDRERANLSQHGMMFKWLQPEGGFINLPQVLSETMARKYERKARVFFGREVNLDADPRSLYEDSEGAFIIGRFKGSDKACFLLLDQMRKVINNNVRVLAVSYSLIVALVFVLNLLYGESIDFARMIESQITEIRQGEAGEAALINGETLPQSPSPQTAQQSTPLATPQTTADAVAETGTSGQTRTRIGDGTYVLNFLGDYADQVNRSLFAATSCLVAAILMWLFYYVEYVPYQRNNVRELNNFITRYLALLTNGFRAAQANAGRVTVGQEPDPRKLAKQAQLWVGNFHWFAFRTFYIETFLRNSIFQIRRNSNFYLVFVPLFFAFGVFVAVEILLNMEAGRAVLLDGIARLNGSLFWPIFAVLIFLYVRFLTSSIQGVLSGIKPDEWIGFDELEIHRTLSSVVGKYAEEVGYWKNRMSGA